MIKYIGSKRRHVASILDIVARVDGVRRVLDAFSGTSRVAHALKAAGLHVVANDHNAYAHVLARCYVEADATQVLERARSEIDDLSRVPPRAGWFTETFAVRSRYFHPRNAARIEAIREAIAARALPRDVEAVCLTSLLEAADRVDSTTGVQMAYLKRWAPRALRDLELRVPALLPGGGEAICEDARDAAARHDVDLAYLDPPYNRHSYRGNYHVWETLVRWDHPDVYGVACKRVDCREHRSAFNVRATCVRALESVLDALRARAALVSFNDEGFIGRAEMESLLARRGSIEVRAADNPRYVGARIGIYNPRGEKVGRVSHLTNTEYLYLLRFTAPPEERTPRVTTSAAASGA